MGKKILDSKLLYAFLAIVIAIGLWFYVAVVENANVDEEITINNIPVRFVNIETLEENGLMLSGGMEQVASLTLRGSRSDLVALQQEKDKINLTVDVGKITSPGEQRIAYSRSLPSAYQSSVQVVEFYPSNVDFTVSRRIDDRAIPIMGKLEGTVAENYMRGVFEFLPVKIGVTGAESDVNQISHALVTIRGENLTTTVEGEMPFELISHQGEVLTDLDVILSAETIFTTMPVTKTADVPLTVKWVFGGGISNLAQVGQYVTCGIDPETITVAGAESDLESLTEIILGEIDLSDINGSDVFEFDIPLDSELDNISGVKRASVSVSIRGLESKIMEVDNIQLDNVPEGFEADSVTKTLQVLVRGPQEALDLVLPINLRAVADLSDVDPIEGRYTVPVKVYLAGTTDVGVVGSDYKIVVDITE